MLDTNPEPGTRRVLISEKEAAERVGVHHRTMQTWRARKCAPPHFCIGLKTIRYDANRLDDWLQSRARAA